MAAAAGSRSKKKATGTKPAVPPKRGQVLRSVVASIILLFRRNRAPHGRRGNRVPASGGHVEPEPDVAARRATAANGCGSHANPNANGSANPTATNYLPANN